MAGEPFHFLILHHYHGCHLRSPGRHLSPEEGRYAHGFSTENFECSQKSDFVSGGVRLDSPSFRPKHRNHVARLARLVFDKLEAAEEALNAKASKPASLADLIMFPELAVHP